ncbi:Mitofusin-2 [Cichlidogyrus casuarinus]|uniref:Mitofusin-2 n=1 Tax=Cichlidogyrus casuarinus TaxID=1844966 RepID=A0ABD2QK16_9PLAT
MVSFLPPVDTPISIEKFHEFVSEDSRNFSASSSSKVKAILSVIDRNQMKCAFFGRTSNGKSTVINAMLGSKILPSGLGHTTSCFVQVEGTKEDSGSLYQDDNLVPIESVNQLANALSTDTASSDALLRLLWPSKTCNLLKEDVVLLDSPGVNVDPNMDSIIDNHCLDADVFVLVVNAESTLMQAEKDFFHKVSQKLSKPNIFVLNNRWDAAADEESIDQIRQQHLERCVAFLADELKVCTREEAHERVFFVSAREVLAQRMKSAANQGNNTPPGAAPMSPLSSAYNLASGWQDRMFEFQNFEKVFEKILSISATKTKFSSHAEQGRDLANRFRLLMDTLYESCVEKKDEVMKERMRCQMNLDQLHARLQKTVDELNVMIDQSLVRVEAHVSQALSVEIRRLADLVESYNRRAFTDERTALHTYKKELNEHVEKELGRKLALACSNDIRVEVARAEKTMIGKMESMVLEQQAKIAILTALSESGFEPEFHVDCRNLCSDFHEDLTFRFSLGWSSLVQRFSATQMMKRTWGHEGTVMAANANQLLPMMSHVFPSLLSRNSLGGLVILFLMTRAAGVNLLGLLASLYAGLYVYERLSWTNRAKEASFKRQYVAYASQKLKYMVDMTSSNARHQVKGELSRAMKKLKEQVDTFALSVQQDLSTHDLDITTLERHITDAKLYKYSLSFLHHFSTRTQASHLDDRLLQFCMEHMN